MNEKNDQICSHIDIPEMRVSISSVVMAFQVHELSRETGVGQPEQVRIVMPYQVLADLALSLPKVLADMKEAGADKTIFEPRRPS